MAQNAHTQSSILTNTGSRDEITAAFVLRLTWDAHTLDWRILLRSVNQEETRLFANLESVILHLESWMAKQVLNSAFHSELGLPFNEETQSQ